MPDTTRRRPIDEVARLGEEMFERCVKPKLGPDDDGKLYAVDILSGDFEVNHDDYTAVMTLRTRRPEAEIWLGRVGDVAAHRIRGHR